MPPKALFDNERTRNQVIAVAMLAVLCGSLLLAMTKTGMQRVTMGDLSLKVPAQWGPPVAANRSDAAFYHGQERVMTLRQIVSSKPTTVAAVMQQWRKANEQSAVMYRKPLNATAIDIESRDDIDGLETRFVSTHASANPLEVRLLAHRLAIIAGSDRQFLILDMHKPVAIGPQFADGDQFAPNLYEGFPDSLYEAIVASIQWSPSPPPTPPTTPPTGPPTTPTDSPSATPSSSPPPAPSAPVADTPNGDATP